MKTHSINHYDRDPNNRSRSTSHGGKFWAKKKRFEFILICKFVIVEIFFCLALSQRFFSFKKFPLYRFCGRYWGRSLNFFTSQIECDLKLGDFFLQKVENLLWRWVAFYVTVRDNQKWERGAMGSKILRTLWQTNNIVWQPNLFHRH